MTLTEKQVELFRRLGDYVRLAIECGMFPPDGMIGNVYRDCVEGGCPVKAPALPAAQAAASPAQAIRDYSQYEYCGKKLSDMSIGELREAAYVLGQTMAEAIGKYPINQQART